MTTWSISKLIGARIRRAREANGFSLTELGQITGNKRSYFGNVESGTKGMSIAKLLHIALALDVDPGELLPTRSEILNTIERSTGQ